MIHSRVIKKTAAFVKKELRSEGSGHDWWHSVRVWQTAKHLQNTEGGDLLIIELASLLHDIADRKLNDGDEVKGIKRVSVFLSSLLLTQEVIDKVLTIISTSSYSHHLKNNQNTLTLEGRIVQDADRLDAIGAIGIARAFSYGGRVGRPLFDPSIHWRKEMKTKDYIAHPSPTINHFYEKLLLLKGLMNTQTAKRIAKKRHDYMMRFLNQFMFEWDGTDQV